MKKKVLLIPLTVILALGLTFDLCPAQSVSPPMQAGQTINSSPVISMDFQDADLKDVLKVFSQQAGLNFIASENIKDRKVTLYLDKVSVQDALNTIMNANNLTYEQEKQSKIFVVKEWGKPAIETVTKVFPLQYARVRGYELTGAGARTRQQGQQIGIKEVVEKLLSEHGRVIEDGRTNSLIVSDVPSQFPKIEQAIRELDIKLPQVMIEAEIVEATLDAIDKLGIEWGDATSGALASSFGAAKSTKYPFTTGSNIGPGGDHSGLMMGYISANNLGGTLAMLAKDTDTRILARPKILTLNNETAEIKITADTAVSSATVQTAAEGLATQSTTIERYETGVSLEVTPQINISDEITMSISPSVVTTKLSTILSNVSDPQRRSANTTVTLRDGETVIIGGLINTEDTKISRKVPFFGDIPLLGSLFRKNDNTTMDKELIIFITPHLVKEGAKSRGLAMEKQSPWEYENLGLKEEAMENILDGFEQ